ncbi:ABC transporter ATP-binding protein [Terrarubrum flagellatum]|uniref:ABC transporter ATP-binding protein n=1 Tax=Terrirubrum flagellatum TaxID=2895980 RepID=UPI0031454364
MTQSPLLSIRDLRTHFFNADGVTRAVDGVSFDVGAGETLAVVGESGCGKSVTALSVLRLLPDKVGRIVGGEVLFEGRNLVNLGEAEMRAIRGNSIAMIFQEPMTSLNPVFTIGEQIAEAVRIHEGLGAKEAEARAVEMLRLVRIPDPERRVRDYPHQFSGGMRQRAMIAMALACGPRLLIADEPTTALDVTIQAQILKLIRDLQSRTGTAVVLITHDLGVVAETCDRVVVVYAGRKVEEALVEDLFERPLHPYTRGLMASLPRMHKGKRRGRLNEIAGIVPSLREPIVGCAFAPRCPMAIDRCRAEAPELRALESKHIVACHRAELVAA